MLTSEPYCKVLPTSEIVTSEIKEFWISFMLNRYEVYNRRVISRVHILSKPHCCICHHCLVCLWSDAVLWFRYCVVWGVDICCMSLIERDVFHTLKCVHNEWIIHLTDTDCPYTLMNDQHWLKSFVLYSSFNDLHFSFAFHMTISK